MHHNSICLVSYFFLKLLEVSSSSSSVISDLAFIASVDGIVFSTTSYASVLCRQPSLLIGQSVTDKLKIASYHCQIEISALNLMQTHLAHLCLGIWYWLLRHQLYPTNTVTGSQPSHIYCGLYVCQHVPFCYRQRSLHKIGGGDVGILITVIYAKPKTKLHDDMIHEVSLLLPSFLNSHLRLWPTSLLLAVSFFCCTMQTRAAAELFISISDKSV